MKAVFFVSRNKDNKHVKDFKERKRVFFYKKCPLLLLKSFNDFVEKGKENEVSRLYISVNTRNEEKAKKDLICDLVSNDNFDLTKINAKATSVAMMSKNAVTKKWLFDFDVTDESQLQLFLNDIYEMSGLLKNQVNHFNTPHGYAVITERGFDTRNLLEKWKGAVELKRDAMLLYDFQTNTI